MPLYMPKTSFSRSQAVTVWGEARPAKYGTGAQTVAIQFQAHGKGAWKTLQTVKSKTYFSVTQKFAGSGNVRLAYTYPEVRRAAARRPGGQDDHQPQPGDHGAMSDV